MRVAARSTCAGPAFAAAPAPHSRANARPLLRVVPRPAPVASKLLARAQGDGDAPPTEDEWEEEEGPNVDDFEDVTITGLGEDDDTVEWADYLAMNVVGSSVVEILDEERLAGVELSVSPVAAAAAAAIAAAAADAATSGIAAASPTAAVATAAAVEAAGAAVSATRFFERSTLSLLPEADDLSAWDLRAGLEKRRRMEREAEAWQEEQRRTVGRFRATGVDWRSDKRIADTGDPTDPAYREWTLQEIWRLICMDGMAVDPRVQAAVTVASPSERTDFPAEGYREYGEAHDFLAAKGLLIKEEDLAAIIDGDAEALLAADLFTLDEGWTSPDAAPESAPGSALS